MGSLHSPRPLNVDARGIPRLNGWRSPGMEALHGTQTCLSMLGVNSEQRTGQSAFSRQFHRRYTKGVPEVQARYMTAAVYPASHLDVRPCRPGNARKTRSQLSGSGHGAIRR